ncbi:hypothetical protein [Epilithonimonas sp. UC225_85]|uniref:hypothetical protein n=1 Tax=Epilithonimonas sp. UC225_85 TaxID=3350167 RepID=UPI0036D243F4
MGSFNYNIKYKEYSTLPLEQREILNELLESATANIHLEKRKPIQEDFWFLTWKQIEELRSDIGENNIDDVLNLVYSLEENEIGEIILVNVISSYKWVIEQLESIAETEKYEMEEAAKDPKAEKAGVDRFRKYEFYNSLHVLSEGKIWKEDEVLQYPYWQVFRNLNMRNDKANYEKAYSELK